MIINRFKPYIGGAEKQAERMARAMVMKGHRVTVLTRKWDKSPRREFFDGVKILRLPCIAKGTLAPLTFMFCCLCYIWWFRKEIQLLHAHQHDSAFIAGVAKIVTGIKVIAHFHGGLHDVGSEVKMLTLGRKGKIMVRVVKKYTDVFIAVSKPIEEDLLATGFTGEIYILPNGVDVDKFTPEEVNQKIKFRKKLGIPLNAVVFIFSGRLEPVKGTDILMQAWQSLDQQTASNSVLVILGQGSQYDSLMRIGKSLPNCFIKGSVDNVIEYLKAADAFVMPSRYEGTSLAVLEAMACQMPVLLTEVGGNVDLIMNHENGILLPPNDSQQLSRWIKILSQSEKLRNSLGKKARLTAVTYFSFDAIIKDYEKICLDKAS